MSTQDKNGTKKSRGRPATGRGTQVQVRLHDNLLVPLDDLADRIDGSRPEALRFALTSYLEADGLREKPMRLGKSFLVQLSNQHIDALVDAFGESFEAQREGVEQLVSDWLQNRPDPDKD